MWLFLSCIWNNSDEGKVFLYLNGKTVQYRRVKNKEKKVVITC